MTATIEQKAAAWDALVQFQRVAHHRYENGLDGGAYIGALFFGDHIQVCASRAESDDIDEVVAIPHAVFMVDGISALAQAVQAAGDKIGVPFNPADFVGPDCAGQVPS